MAYCYFCQSRAVRKYRTLYRTDLCAVCHASLKEHGILKTLEALDRERSEWVTTRSAQLHSPSTSPPPRSAREIAIRDRVVFQSFGVFLAGTGAVWVLNGNSFASAVAGIAAAVTFYKFWKLRQLEQEKEIIQQEKEASIREHSQHEALRMQKASLQAQSEAEERFGRYRRIKEKAKEQGILLWEYYSNEYPPDWDFRKERVKKRDKYTCRRCRRHTDNLHVHHEIPVRSGGTHHLSNLRTLCQSCHYHEHKDWLDKQSVREREPTTVHAPGLLPTVNPDLHLLCPNKDCGLVLRLKMTRSLHPGKNLRITCPKCGESFLWDPDARKFVQGTGR